MMFLVPIEVTICMIWIFNCKLNLEKKIYLQPSFPLVLDVVQHQFDTWFSWNLRRNVWIHWYQWKSEACLQWKVALFNELLCSDIKKIYLQWFAKVKFGLSEKHTKFEKIFLMVWTFTKVNAQIFVCFSESRNFKRIYKM